MSQDLGLIHCPVCTCKRFSLANWATYISVVCAGCGARMGELNPGYLVKEQQ